MTQLRLLLLSLLFALCANAASAQPSISTTPGLIEYFHAAYVAMDRADYSSAIATMREADRLPNITGSERARIAESILV